MNYIRRLVYLSNCFTNAFGHLLNHIPDGYVVDLNLERGLAKDQFMDRWVVDVPLQNHQVFVEAPWLIMNYFVDLLLVVKEK